MSLSPSDNAAPTTPATGSAAPVEQCVVIAGVGLIGGSLAAALRKRRLARRIVGLGRDAGRLEAARQAGLIDEGVTDPAALAGQPALWVFCTPVERIAEGVRAVASRCPPGTLITDAGSVKGPICEALADLAGPRGLFVGSHPLAGSEKQGFEHADPDLYEGRVCVVTPREDTPGGVRARLVGFWQSVGATIVAMSPAEHDRALAETSHLPHVAAAALAGLLRPDSEQLAATGFRDTTRIAAGDPALWTGILLSNRDGVLRALDHYAEQLRDFRQALDRSDAGALQALLAQGKSRRDALDRPDE